MDTIRKVIIAIEQYKQDIVQFPIYFEPNSIEYLDTKLALDNICAKYDNPDYRVENAIYYSIPYDGISTRNAYHLNIDDTIIRYILAKSLSSSTSIYTNTVDSKPYSIYALIDIYDFYSQIDNGVFIETIKQTISNKIDKKCLELFEKRIFVHDIIGSPIKGLLIGSKPDEYFAELFLSIIHAKINSEISRYIIRNGDEFVIFSNSVNEIRETITNIEYLLKDYKLSINKAKNRLVYIKEKRMSTRLLPFEQQPLFTSPSCPPPMIPEILFRETNFTITYNNDDLNDKKFDSIHSYEDSINFLKALSTDLEKVKAFNNKYPEYHLFNDWNSSTPLEAEQMYKEINWSLLTKPNSLDNLETIIYRFPRSQYYSAMAIHFVCVFATVFYYNYCLSAKNSDKKVYIVDDIDFSHINQENSTLLVEKANSILLNALRSQDIYDYQKYLILRELFFDKQSLSINKSNFNLKSNLPFPILIIDSLKNISSAEIGGPFAVITNAILSMT